MKIDDKSAKVLDLMFEWNAALKAIGGCSDGNCVVHRPTGMHTNGGCRCSEDRIIARRVMRLSAYYRRSIADAVGLTVTRS